MNATTPHDLSSRKVAGPIELVLTITVAACVPSVIVAIASGTSTTDKAGCCVTSKAGLSTTVASSAAAVARPV